MSNKAGTTIDQRKLVKLLLEINQHMIASESPRAIFDAAQVTSGSSTAAVLRKRKIPPFDSDDLPGSAGPRLFYSKMSLCLSDQFVSVCRTDATIRSRVSESAIRTSIDGLVGYLQWQPDRSETEAPGLIRELVELLRSMIRPYTVFFPINNFKLVSVPKLEVGHATFFPISDFDQIEDDLRLRIQRFAKDEEQRAANEVLADRLVGEFHQAGVYAAVETECETNQALQNGSHHLERALNVLRVCGAYESGAQHSQLGTAADARRSPSPYLVMPSQGGYSMPNGSFVGPLAPYVLNQERVLHLRTRCHLDALSQLIRQTDHRNKLEMSVDSALHWIARGLQTEGLAEGLLFFVTALETLLLGPVDRGDLTERFATRLAIVLAERGTQRCEAYKLARKVYGHRSLVVHTGKTDCLEDVDQLGNIAIHVLMWTLEKLSSWDSYDKVNEYFLEQLLSGTAAETTSTPGDSLTTVR